MARRHSCVPVAPFLGPLPPRSPPFRAFQSSLYLLVHLFPSQSKHAGHSDAEARCGRPPVSTSAARGMLVWHSSNRHRCRAQTDHLAVIWVRLCALPSPLRPLMLHQGREQGRHPPRSRRAGQCACGTLWAGCSGGRLRRAGRRQRCRAALPGAARRARMRRRRSARGGSTPLPYPTGSCSRRSAPRAAAARQPPSGLHSPPPSQNSSNRGNCSRGRRGRRCIC